MHHLCSYRVSRPDRLITCFHLFRAPLPCVTAPSFGNLVRATKDHDSCAMSGFSEVSTLSTESEHAPAAPQRRRCGRRRPLRLCCSSQRRCCVLSPRSPFVLGWHPGWRREFNLAEPAPEQCRGTRCRSGPELPPCPACSEQMSLEEVRARIAQFADERSWQQYHTPRNLLLALVGEVRRGGRARSTRSPLPPLAS